jgi:hypothetical protein
MPLADIHVLEAQALGKEHLAQSRRGSFERLANGSIAGREAEPHAVIVGPFGP